MCFIKILTSFTGTLSFSSACLLCLWVVSHNPTFIVGRGLIFHLVVECLNEQHVFVGFFSNGSGGESIVAIGEFYECLGLCYMRLGLKGRCLLLVAPSTHRKYNIKWAMHVHCNSHYVIMIIWGQDCWFPTLIRVWHLLCLFDWSVCAIWWMTLLNDHA